MTLAGRDITLNLTTTRTLSIENGTLTITGQDIGIARSEALTLDISEASLTILGHNCEFTWSTPWDESSLTLAGQTLTLDLSVVLGAGALTLAGQDITAETGTEKYLSVEPGAMSLDGQDIGLKLDIDYALSIEPGDIGIVGQSLTAGIELALGAGAAELAGQVIPLDIGLALGAGALAITGQDLTTDVEGSFLLSIEPGALTLDGSQITLDISVPGSTRPPGGAGYPVGIYWQGKRRKKRLIDQPNLHLKKILDDVVRELYGEISEDAPADVQAKAAKLVKPFVAGKAKKLAVPPESAVDWSALERDGNRVQALVALWRKQEIEREIEDEDEYMLMVD